VDLKALFRHELRRLHDAIEQDYGILVESSAFQAQREVGITNGNGVRTNFGQRRIGSAGNRHAGNQDGQQRDEREYVLGSNHINDVCP
jgi:hypothetical protein